MTCSNPNCQAHVVGSTTLDRDTLPPHWAALYEAYKREARERLYALREIRKAIELDDDPIYILDKVEGILINVLEGGEE